MRKTLSVLLAITLITLMFSGVAVATGVKTPIRRIVRGRIVSLDTTAATVGFLRRNGHIAILKVTGHTIIKKNGRRVGFRALALADRGRAKFIRTADGKKALKIFVRTPFMNGRITGVTTDTITLKRRRVTRTFKVDENIRIRQGGASVDLADVTVGNRAVIFFNRLNAGGFRARRILVAGK